MSSTTVAGGDVHGQLIHAAFIDPIRTVIVVDDEYPTLDSLAAKEVADKNDAWSGKEKDVQSVRDLLSFARKRAKPWLVDVHDGRKIPTEAEYGIATHLDHSDLLVLDYHLDGNGGSGDKAINILRRLAQSGHFNLVIVHTQGVEGVLDGVIREIALGLTCIDQAYLHVPAEKEKAVTALEKWREVDPDITEKLKSGFSQDDYLQLRIDGQSDFHGMLTSTDFGKNVFDVWKSKPKDVNIPPKDLLKWVVAEKQEQLSNQFSKANLGTVLLEHSEETNWIRTDNLFITVLSKQCDPDNFEIKITEAIKNSYPSPHQLLLTKMRANIAQYGLSAEAEILGNKQVQAELLKDFLNDVPTDTQVVIRNTISRHWDALGGELIGNLSGYAEELRKYFVPLGVVEVINKCGFSSVGVNTTESLKHFNCFISTKPIDRSHLTTGHIFQVEAPVAGGSPSFWICLSPACDMVPGQKSQPGLQDCIRFVAVRLHKVADEMAVINATNNAFLFIECGEKIETYSLYSGGDVTKNPTWEQKFARNQGQFAEEHSVMLGSIQEKDNELTTVWVNATVVAQLRSEYALNLLQRIGALLSRPGLGMNFKNQQ